MRVINYSCGECTNKNCLMKSLIYHIYSFHEKSMIFSFTCDKCSNEICHMTQLMNHIVCVHDKFKLCLIQIFFSGEPILVCTSLRYILRVIMGKDPLLLYKMNLKCSSFLKVCASFSHILRHKFRVSQCSIGNWENL